jgi:hypothetical protein
VASAKRRFWYSKLLKTALRNRMSPALFDALIAYSYHNPSQETRAASAEKRHGKPRSYKPGTPA